MPLVERQFLFSRKEKSTEDKYIKMKSVIGGFLSPSSVK